MKNKVMTVLAVVLAITFAVTVYAYTPSSSAPVSGGKTSCCKGDSCPMKNNQSGEAKKDCCDKQDCSCKGGADNCPMKKDEAKKSGDCCGGSCPMKKDK